MTTGVAGFEGFAPKVLVRTIEQTRLDQAADAEAARVRQEAIKLAQERLPPNLTPIRGVCDPTTEQAKYQKMWDFPQYRAVAPGEEVAQIFLAQARPKAGSTVIDFGAGTGRGALMLAVLGNVRVEMFDFASNSLDPEVKEALTTQAHMLRFTQHDLNHKLPLAAQYGFCTDVMEHIPPVEVDRVLQNVLRAAQHVFFQIACTPDHCGQLINDHLHLTVENYAWWLNKLQALDCTVHWSQDMGSHCMFYVSAWQDGLEFVKHGVLNMEEAVMVENVKANLEKGIQEVVPHIANDMEMMILGGGPSLAGQLETIKTLRAAGAKLCTLNGTYNWALENGLKPSGQIVIDGRDFNARFTKPVVDDCKYLIASQVHPSVLDGLPPEKTYLWHTTMKSIVDAVKEKREIFYPVPGGSTVMLRAIPLLRMLGFKRFHLFGFDSCLVGDSHHAYPQPENDSQIVIKTTVGDRVFDCHPWMISQAREFMDLIRFLGDEIELEVYGDGLISHILRTGAEFADHQEWN